MEHGRNGAIGKSREGDRAGYGSIGVMECWSIGVMECWSVGVMECWSDGVLECWSDGVLEWGL